MSVKRIGVLTSGGDAPGMNPCVRAVVRTALYHGLECYGIRRGWNGLISGDVVRLDEKSVSHTINKGGTILYTARSKEFMTEEGQRKAVSTCKFLGLDSIIAIGGDGTFRGATDLSIRGIPTIGLPGTIDNDLNYTDFTIGFDTAVSTVLDAISKIRDTSSAHDRTSVIEVMGRHCGDIAINTGIAVGATSIIIPEIECDFEKDVIERIKTTQSMGKRHFIIIVAEHCADSFDVAKQIQEKTGIQARTTILGHVQRGGSPTLRDRVVASLMGCRAVDVLIKGKRNRVIAKKCNNIVDYNIDEVLELKKNFDYKLYTDALHISI